MSAQNVEFLVSNPRWQQAKAGGGAAQPVFARVTALGAKFLRALWLHIARWHQRRLAFRQLSALDDAALKDIGLHRSGIEAAVIKVTPSGVPQKTRAFPQKPHLCLHRTG